MHDFVGSFATLVTLSNRSGGPKKIKINRYCDMLPKR